MSFIPKRFQYEWFVRYAPYLGAALKAYPKATKAVPVDESLETLAAHLRNCRTAKLRYQYQHPSINEELFRRYGNTLSFAIRADHVLIGPREALRDTNVLLSQPNQEEIEVDRDHLHAVCKLVNDKALTPCPIFFVRNLSETTLQLTELAFPNLVLTLDPNEPGRYTIL